MIPNSFYEKLELRFRYILSTILKFFLEILMQKCRGEGDIFKPTIVNESLHRDMEIYIIIMVLEY